MSYGRGIAVQVTIRLRRGFQPRVATAVTFRVTTRVTLWVTLLIHYNCSRLFSSEAARRRPAVTSVTAVKGRLERAPCCLSMRSLHAIVI